MVTTHVLQTRSNQHLHLFSVQQAILIRIVLAKNIVNRFLYIACRVAKLMGVLVDLVLHYFTVYRREGSLMLWDRRFGP